MYSLRSLRENIFLIGDIDTQIYGNKLPSKLQVLRVLFFNLRHLKLALNDSSSLVVKEVSVFWEKARLPIQQLCRCEKKLKDLYETWRNLQKSAGKPYNLQKERHFCSTLNDLFDIGHGNINEMIDDTTRQFLMNQRQSGRVGYIGDIETIYDAEENAQLRRDEESKARLDKSKREKEILGECFNFFVEF